MYRIPLLVALATAPAPAVAQPRYLPQPDTLYYESLNPHHLYVVRGGDTLGVPVRPFTVERQVWRGSGDELTVGVWLDTPGDPGAATRDTLRVDGRGRVTALPGSTQGSAGRWDFVLRLPGGHLRPGTTWHDTLDAPQGARTENAFQVWRELRVERIADTLGTRMAVVRGTGTVRFRQTFGDGDSPWWMEVAGPTDETFLFDLAHGRLAAREWSMRLRGITGFPGAAGATDTFPAALVSADTMRQITPERARLLTRGLPAGDTTWSAGAFTAVHTVRREGGRMESGFVRPDGMLTTVRADYEAGRPTRYEMLATEGLQEPVRRTVVANEGRLRVSGERDTVMPLPEGYWAVADYGMHEHLAPVVARLSAGGEAEAALPVYRPYPMLWDTVNVSVRPVTDQVLVAVLRADEVVEVLLLENGGTLLYVERVEPQVARRIARAGTREHKRVESLIAEVVRLLRPK